MLPTETGWAVLSRRRTRSRQQQQQQKKVPDTDDSSQIISIYIFCFVCIKTKVLNQRTKGLCYLDTGKGSKHVLVLRKFHLSEPFVYIHSLGRVTLASCRVLDVLHDPTAHLLPGNRACDYLCATSCLLTCADTPAAHTRRNQSKAIRGVMVHEPTTISRR